MYDKVPLESLTLRSKLRCSQEKPYLPQVLCVAVSSEIADANLLPAGDVSPKLVPADVSAVNLALSCKVSPTWQTQLIQWHDVTAQ